ncbi:metal ABC transporter permease [Candidatus Leptofilum sp.]|uniref:metal ABC transporter permease n=1 Tax=Candidatus Leptofilum sp. TaxID=3241576 RepID=UPI003B5AA410
MMSRHLSVEDRRVWLLIGAITILALLFLPFSQLVLQVNYDYTLRTVALGGALLGIVSGVLGCFAVLRQQSLMGDALSHAALPGVAIAFLVAGRELGFLLIGAGIASWLGVQFIQSVTKTTRIKQDTAMGVVLAAWFAAGIALLAYIQARPDASQAGLDTFIFGQAAAIIERDVRLIAVVGAASFVVLGLFWKEFKLVTFDVEFAGANGFRVNLFNILLSTLIVIAIVLGLQLAGVILMVGMLIAPGIAARQWTNKLTQMVILAAVFGAFAGGTGAILSAVDTDIPTGPMIIVVAFLLVVLSIAFAPGRGLAWTLLRQRGDRRRFAAQTVLNDLFHYAYDHGSLETAVPEEFLLGVSGTVAKAGLDQLQSQGYVQNMGDKWQLTPHGTEVASQTAQNALLWDIYRQYSDELNLPLIAEDRQRNIRELLPAAAVAQLEQKLGEGIT